MMPSTLPTLTANVAGQAGKPGADIIPSPVADGLPGMPVLPQMDLSAWPAAGTQPMDGVALPQIPQLFVANQDGAAAGVVGAAAGVDGGMQMPMLQMPSLPLAGQLPLFMPFPLVPIASGTAGATTTAGLAGAVGTEGQPWAVTDPTMAGSLAGTLQLPAVTMPAGVAAAAARAQAEATAVAARAAKAAAPPVEAGSRRRPVRRAASLAAAAWASSDEDEQEEEEGWVRPKRARRGVADLAAGPPAAPPAGPSQYQQRRLAAQQLQLEVVEVAGVAARMVACVAAACGEPVLPDTLGMLPGAADAQRAAATPQQPMSYAQLLMQELPEEGGSPTVASATDPPRVSRFGRTVRPSVHRTGGLAAAALALEAPAPRPSSGRPGRPPRSAVYAADGGLAPLLSDDAEPQEDKVCVECGTRTTPLWRTINGLTYCNADGLRMKRKLGML